MDRAPATSHGRSRTHGRLECRTWPPRRTGGPDELAQGDRQGPLGDEPRHRHRQAYGAARLGGARCLRRMPLATQGDREGCSARHAVARFLRSGAISSPGSTTPTARSTARCSNSAHSCKAACSQPGVTCSNCHEPHSLKLRAEGNGLCAQCHLPAKFDVAEHHHHAPGSAGAQCVGCHMPTKTYMVVDRRRDHSFRVPRPDLSASLGTPNACTAVPRRSPAGWAARAIAGWYPQGRQTTPHYGAALHAGRAGAVDAEQQLDQLILDRSQPEMARASALLLLPRYATPASEAAIKAAIADPSALVRSAVPRALPPSPPHVVDAAIAPLLRDPVRAVRIETARALAGADPHGADAGSAHRA